MDRTPFFAAKCKPRATSHRWASGFSCSAIPSRELLAPTQARQAEVALKSSGAGNNGRFLEFCPVKSLKWHRRAIQSCSILTVLSLRHISPCAGLPLFAARCCLCANPASITLMGVTGGTHGRTSLQVFWYRWFASNHQGRLCAFHSIALQKWNINRILEWQQSFGVAQVRTAPDKIGISWAFEQSEGFQLYSDSLGPSRSARRISVTGSDASKNASTYTSKSYLNLRRHTPMSEIHIS